MKPMIVVAAVAASRPALANPGYETYAKLYERLSGGATAQALEDKLPGLAGNLRSAKEISAKYLDGQHALRRAREGIYLSPTTY